jgi:hypothetical protein
VLDVYGVTHVKPGEDVWKSWEGHLPPAGLPDHTKRSVRVHASASRLRLAEAMCESRVMLHLGHKAEAFCLALAEAQAYRAGRRSAGTTMLCGAANTSQR